MFYYLHWLFLQLINKSCIEDNSNKSEFWLLFWKIGAGVGFLDLDSGLFIEA